MKQCAIFKLMFSLVMLSLIGASQTAHAAFDSGSTGADGEFAPTSNTVLQIPESGIFNFTTINIPSGVTVTFTKNSQNTPVTMLATGDVTIAGTINLNGGSGNYIIPGAGGPGGFDGGVGGVVNQTGKRGEGPGGGVGGSARTNSDLGAGSGGGGGFSGGGGGGGTYTSDSPGGAGGTTYSNERILPLTGGSGGAGGGGTRAYVGGGGGGGGGAIVIASSGTINVSGSITANGGTGANGEHRVLSCNRINFCGGGGGGGSGGSIRLIAETISGNGTISAENGGGGEGYCGCCSWKGGGGGSAGRIRLEASSVTRTAGTNPPMSLGYPYAVVPENMPTLVISSAGGVDSPSVPKGSFGSPDVMLPFNTQNPVTVVITGVNIPANTTITLKATPAVGTVTTATGTLSGTSSSVSIPINISKAYPSLLTASVTFQLASLGIGPLYAQGELVEQVRVEAAMGGGSTMTYITASGKEVPVSQLKS